jgi:hypothetical protein
MYELSILIPARQEMFISNTVADILKNKRGKTEIIVGLDGAWANPPIIDHPDVRIVHVSESIGQRAMTNKLCKLSKAKWVAKVDAHCTFDEGFDVKLLNTPGLQDNWTIVPLMKNLHAFDWKCPKCGSRWYQGPTPDKCMRNISSAGRGTEPNPDCDNKTGFFRKLVWTPREGGPNGTSYRFDETLHFQYHGEYKKTEGFKAGIIVGYNLSFTNSSLSPRIISLLADFARSHKLACSRDCLWWRQNMTSNTVSLTDVDHRGGIGTDEISLVRDELEMQRITASSVPANMVNNSNAFTPASRDGRNKPSESESVCETFIVEKSTPTITPSINASNPIPTTSSIIKSDVIDELNSILGGEFIYSEKTSSFHNNSITLTLVRNKDLNYTMSLQGSFFMMTRERYWALNICDEAHGSWGQQGTEVACKTWLSGGEVMVNQKTWYAHMFRTQGGDFTFPYPQSQRQIDHARKYSRELFVDGGFKGIHDLQWLINKFAPVPGWEAKAENKGIIYYTDNQLNTKLAKRVQNQIKKSGLPITSASLKPMHDMGKNVVIEGERGVMTMFKQILAALEASESEIVFFCEHDVLYHPSHFYFVPPEKDKFYYNLNVWRVRQSDLKAVSWKANQVAEICVYREHAIEFYRNRIKQVETEGFNRSYEPDGRSHYNFWSQYPNIDIRHDKNLSKSKWSKDDFRDPSTCVDWQETTIDKIEGWDDLHKLLE